MAIHPGSHVLELAKDLAKTFKANAASADKQGALAAADVAAIKTSGILKLTLPKAFGGFEANLRDTLEVQLELAKASGSSALVVAMTSNIVATERECLSWKAALREQLFSSVAQAALLNSAASEPRLGSPSRGGLPDSSAYQEAGMLVINGHKNWVTGGEHLDHLLITLRLGDEAKTVWVPANSPGIRWEKTWGDGLSLRASDSHDLYLENVLVPETHLLYEKPSAASVWFPMLMAATYLGIALAARDEIICYALERVPSALGQPIATLAKVQRQIGEIDVQLDAAKTYLLHTASLWTADESYRNSFVAKIAAAKHLAIESALDATDKVLRIAGGAAIDKSLAFERYFRDTRAGIMHPPSGDTALEIVGRSSLGF